MVRDRVVRLTEFLTRLHLCVLVDIESVNRVDPMGVMAYRRIRVPGDRTMGTDWHNEKKVVYSFVMDSSTKGSFCRDG